VFYQAPPVRLVIDGVAPRGMAPLRPEPQEGGRIAFGRLPSGRVRLLGHVVWDERDDERLRRTGIVRVFVNGFQQLPATLRPAVGSQRERGFEADLLLNQPRNQVEVALPDHLEKDASSPARFNLACEKPERAQRLHLLLVSAQARDGKPLEERFLKAVQSSEDQQVGLRAAAFERVFVYVPLVGSDVRREYLLNHLHAVRTRIRDLSAGGSPASDVVVFYYQGGEAVNAQGNLFQAAGGAGRPGRQTAFTCDDLVKFFADTPGAHVLLFDVGRGAPPREAARDRLIDWDDSYPEAKNMAVLRYAFLGRPDAPQDPSLLQALQEFMPRSVRLVDVTEQVRRLAEAVRTGEGVSLRFSEHLPGPIGGMVISKQP
jgi:hypothetical protein